MKFLIFLAVISLVESQSEGGFWWLNKGLMKGASESRSVKDQSSKIRTLPPRFRGSEVKTTTTTVKTSIFGDDDEDERSMFKYDDEPDCSCTPKYLCNENNTIITDGNGLIDERSFNVCGLGNVCCRIPKSTSEAPSTTTTRTTTTTTTHRNFLNIGNIISTILKPVPSSNPYQPIASTCSSRKGKKIEKRILLDEDYEDDDDALIGETAFAEYPWMVELLKKSRKTDKFEYKCGSVLVNPTTALTANHCLKGSNVKPSNFIIRAGEWDRSSTLEFAPHHDRPLSQIIAHPQYYSGGLHNDVAILKWHNPLPAEVNVAPICLPDETEVFAAGTYCTVTGWGKASEDALTTDKLKFAKVPIVNNPTCQRQFQDTTRLGRRFNLHASFICAGGEFGIDSCQNDGGGPLICPRGDGSFVLAGLVSWGLGCGQKDVPGAYTNIQYLLKWLKSHQIN